MAYSSHYGITSSKVKELTAFAYQRYSDIIQTDRLPKTELNKLHEETETAKTEKQ